MGVQDTPGELLEAGKYGTWRRKVPAGVDHVVELFQVKVSLP
jgi:hypothetical protein